MAKRVDCWFLRLSCLEIAVTSSKLNGQDYEVAMEELEEVRRNIENTGMPVGLGTSREVGSPTAEGAVEGDI